jgi:hypothetical protein
MNTHVSTSGCEVLLNDDCTDAPGGVRVRTRCYVCGKPTCRGCSDLVKGHRRSRVVRMCQDCQEDSREDFNDGKLTAVEP